jgi:hypothetical protein
MSKYIKISKCEITDDLFFKTQKINIKGKKFQTPIKAIDASKLHAELDISDSIKGLNEVFNTFDLKRLNNCLTSDDNASKFNTELKRKINKTSPSEVNLCFIMYEDLKLPDENGINFLMNVSYGHSDATPLPLLPKFFKGDNIDPFERMDNYKNFMQKCIDSINRLNNKPILGIIPEGVPFLFVQDIVEFYYRNDITSFVYDFSGKVNADNTKLREFYVALNQNDLMDNSFLYSANVNNGKMLKSAPVVVAKDIMTYGYGFDALGDQHVKQPLPKEVANAIKLKNKGTFSFRLFNNNDYGYYKSSELSVLGEIYPIGKTEIPFETFKTNNAKSKKAQFLFNSERLGIEALKYQELVKENENTADYFKTKNYVEEKTIKTLEDFRDDIKL